MVLEWDSRSRCWSKMAHAKVRSERKEKVQDPKILFSAHPNDINTSLRTHLLGDSTPMPGMVVHTFNHNTWEAEVGSSLTSRLA